jgi:hypothetical protein
VIGVGGVRHNRGPWIAGNDVEDYAPGDTVAAEPPRIVVVLDLEHAPTDVVGVGDREALDVVPIHRKPPVGPEATTERGDASQVPQAGRADLRMASTALPGLEPSSRRRLAQQMPPSRTPCSAR